MAYLGRALGDLLVAAGVVPKNTHELSLHVPVDGALELRYTVFVDAETARVIAHALLTLAGPAKETTDAD